VLGREKGGQIKDSRKANEGMASPEIKFFKKMKKRGKKKGKGV